MTINAVSRSVVIHPRIDGTLDSAVAGGEAGGGTILSGPALFTLNAESGAVGAVYSGSTGDRMFYDDAQANSGGKSIKVQILHGQPPATCGGSPWFGGRFTLPTAIPAGYNIWYKASFYLPSTLPMGYCYSGSDTAEATTCGLAEYDDGGNGLLKWMVLAPDTGNARLYVNLDAPRRAMGLDNGIYMIAEPQSKVLNNTTQVIPRDQWFTIQVQAYLQSGANAGFMRLWVGSTYIGELTTETLNASTYKINTWGIGNYWNGVPWTDGDGARTDSFWMDDVIIATDYTGFGAPTATDSGGRTYIDPTAVVGGL